MSEILKPVNVTKAQLRIAYGWNQSTFSTRFYDVCNPINKKRQILSPKELQQMIDEYGEPDWKLIR